MLRFIIKKRWRSDAESGANGEQYETHDIDVPELERLLFRRGGMSQYGFEVYDLAGIELRNDSKE
jgi:hypothetical protein